MNRAIRSAGVMTSALLLLFGFVAASAQTSVDSENNYANVGAIMIWRVDESGKPVQLLAFASGTLIRPRVMVTAGHVTAPSKALGQLAAAIRLFASFSATDVRDPATWIPVTAQATHPSIPTAHRRRDAIRLTTSWSLRSNQASLMLDSSSSNVRRPTSSRPCSRRRARSRDPKALAQRSRIRHHVTGRQGCRGGRMGMGRQAAHQNLDRAKDRR